MQFRFGSPKKLFKICYSNFFSKALSQLDLTFFSRLNLVDFHAIKPYIEVSHRESPSNNRGGGGSGAAPPSRARNVTSSAFDLDS